MAAAKRRRIHACGDQPQQNQSLPLMLLGREQGLSAATQRTQQQLTLQLIKLEGSFDTHERWAATQPLLPTFMQQPSAVSEMVLHDHLLFVRLQSGLCPVYDVSGVRHVHLGYLNKGREEVIRSLVLNRHGSTAAVVTVSCRTTDTEVLLHCTSTPAVVRSFSAGSMFCSAGRPILEVVGGWGFVEFDDSCSKALLLNTHSRQYKVYDMTAEYRLLFTLSAVGVAELELSAQYLLLIQQPFAAAAAAAGDNTQQALTPLPPGSRLQLSDSQGAGNGSNTSSVQLQVYSAANGQLLAQHVLVLPCMVPSGSPFDVLELCGNKLLLKLPFAPLEVREVLSMRLCGRGTHEHLSQLSSFIHLQPRDMFLTVCHHTLTTWSFKLDVVAQFEDHELWYPGTHHSDTVYITDDWVVSLCRAKADGRSLPAADEPGAIHVSNLTSGRLLAAVSVPQGAGSQCCRASHSNNSEAELVRQALTDMTSLFFAEGANAIITGNQHGVVSVFSPG